MIDHRVDKEQSSMDLPASDPWKIINMFDSILIHIKMIVSFNHFTNILLNWCPAIHLHVLEQRSLVRASDNQTIQHKEAKYSSSKVSSWCLNQ